MQTEPASWMSFTICKIIGICLYLDLQYKQICFYFLIFSFIFDWSDFKSKNKKIFNFYNHYSK